MLGDLGFLENTRRSVCVCVCVCVLGDLGFLRNMKESEYPGELMSVFVYGSFMCLLEAPAKETLKKRGNLYTASEAFV